MAYEHFQMPWEVEPQPQTVEELGVALEDLRSEMRLLAASSTIDHPENYLGDQILQAQALVARAKWQMVEGGIRTNEYFVEMYGEVVARRGRLEYHKNSTNDFVGLVSGLRNIPTQTFRGDIIHRLCLGLYPLYISADSQVTSYYARRGLLDTVRHPFGQTEYAASEVWVAVDSLDHERQLRPLERGALQGPQTPENN